MTVRFRLWEFECVRCEVMWYVPSGNGNGNGIWGVGSDMQTRCIKCGSMSGATSRYIDNVEILRADAIY